MPWENRRAVVLNDHAKRLVEEIEAEPSVIIEEITELSEETSIATVTEEVDVGLKMPSCILEYIKEVQKQKMAKSLSSADETLEVVNEMKSLPEELHFPVNQRVEIWEEMVHENCSDEEEVDKNVPDLEQEIPVD